MAKKNENRVLVALVCEDCKTQNYTVSKNKITIKEITDKKTLVEWLTNSLLNIKANNYPSESAPGRAKMPQAFKGGTDEDDKKTSLPDKEGSAMNKLKDDKFMKDAIK